MATMNATILQELKALSSADQNVLKWATHVSTLIFDFPLFLGGAMHRDPHSGNGLQRFHSKIPNSKTGGFASAGFSLALLTFRVVEYLKCVYFD